MSSFNQNNLRLSNEQFFLINILNTMYNDNHRQINTLTNTLNNLINANNQIRILLVQLLNTNHNNNNNNNYNNSNRRIRRTLFDRNNHHFYSQNSIDIPDTLVTGIERPTVNYVNRSNQNNTINQILQSFLQPIEVYPTQSQIEVATRRVRYNDISRPVNTQCPISMDEFNDNDIVTVIRHCGHIFHSNNINNWFRTNCRCPVCRYDIRDYNSNNSNQFFSDMSTDPSNNPIERTNSTETINQNVENNYLNSQLNNAINNTIVRDPSGNIINLPNDLLTSYIFTAFNVQR
jgi:hypothetical protein